MSSTVPKETPALNGRLMAAQDAQPRDRENYLVKILRRTTGC
jgi:hypothetical protein